MTERLKFNNIVNKSPGSLILPLHIMVMEEINENLPDISWFPCFFGYFCAVLFEGSVPYQEMPPKCLNFHEKIEQHSDRPSNVEAFLHMVKSLQSKQLKETKNT